MEKMIENKIKEVVFKARKNGEENIISWNEIEYHEGWNDSAEVKITVNEKYHNEERFVIYFLGDKINVKKMNINSCGVVGEYEYNF